MFPIDRKVIIRRFIDMGLGVVIGMLLAADIIFARNIDMSKAGVSLWIFLAVGAFIVLLQAIPAFILFTTFIGYLTKGIHNSIPVKKEDEVTSKVVEESKC